MLSRLGRRNQGREQKGGAKNMHEHALPVDPWSPMVQQSEDTPQILLLDSK